METGDGCSCPTNRSHFNYNPDINTERKWWTHRSQLNVHTHTHTERDKSFTLQHKQRFKQDPWVESECRFLHACQYVKEAEEECVQRHLHRWRTRDAACMPTHTPTVSQWAVKLKRLFPSANPVVLLIRHFFFLHNGNNSRHNGPLLKNAFKRQGCDSGCRQTWGHRRLLWR